VELMKIPGGTYSQLVHLQENRQEAESPNVDPDMIETNGFDSRSLNSKERRQSISGRSISNGSSSFGRSGRRSFPATLGLPDPMELGDAPNIEEDPTGKVTNVVSGRKKAPISRLFYLNKPEAFVLALGSLTAAMHGVIFPIYGTLISTGIKVFYEPREVLLKDSRFWASMFVVLASCAFLLIPIEYFLFGLAGGKLVERIRSMTFQSVMRQEINWFDKPEHSRYVDLLTDLSQESLLWLSYKLFFTLLFSRSMSMKSVYRLLLQSKCQIRNLPHVIFSLI
jgi:ATP-binding cassette, subfamily B (MDR/TAP), member 1